MKEFKDRVAVVTGAASGIGRGMVKNFVEAGMKVVLADVDEARLEGSVRAFRDSGAAVLGVPTDVSRPEQVAALLRKTLDAFGAVHVLCNNAGVAYGGRSSWEIPLESWRWVIGVNLMGVINGIHSFLPVMIEQNTEAHVVNTASLAGLLINALNIPYAVSKHGVVALSESLCIELQNRGAKVQVSVLCPGPVNTDIMNSSERNRPEKVSRPPELTEQESLLRKGFEIWLEHGSDPEEVGRRVVDAIRAERFYIITHDFDSSIEQRMRGIIDRKNPDVLPPPQDLMEILQELTTKPNGGK